MASADKCSRWPLGLVGEAFGDRCDLRIMKRLLVISALSNLICLGGLILVLTSQRKEASAIPPAAPISQTQSVVASVASPPPDRSLPKPFQWTQLQSTNDYRVYVANLRAAGCPEPTVQDIVSGDAERAFSFMRRRLKLDGTGTGPWSHDCQFRLVASLLGNPLPPNEQATLPAQGPGQPLYSTSTRVPAQDTTQSPQSFATSVIETDPSSVTPTPSQNQAGTQRHYWVAESRYPVVLQNGTADTTELNASQKAVVEQVQEQFVAEVGGSNQDPTDPAYLARWQKAQQNADDAIRGTLGNQFYMGYLLQQYYKNFQQLLANSGDEPLKFNPDSLVQ